MLSEKAEEILVRLVSATGAYLMPVRTDGRVCITVGGTTLAQDDDTAAHRAYFDATEEILTARLIRNEGSGAFELTRRGATVADALRAERDAESVIPDTCLVQIAGKDYTVTYEGIKRGPLDPDCDTYSVTNPGAVIGLNGSYPGYAGYFLVSDGSKLERLAVLSRICNVPCFQHRETLTAAELKTFFKRPGLRAVRQYLLGAAKADENGKLSYPAPHDPEAPLADLKTVIDVVDATDDPRVQILNDCERDVLALLYKAREERRRVGVTAAEVITWPGKRRFYAARDHVHCTLDDLREKGLIRTSDGVQFDVQIERMGDIRKMISGDTTPIYALKAQEIGVASPDSRRSAMMGDDQKEPIDPRKVFVVHGRNDKARKAMFAFLRAAGLHPLEWTEIVAETGMAAPYIGEVLKMGFSLVQAVLVVMTPDDEARLRGPYRSPKDDAYEAELTPQPRPNVLLEAGMALGLYPERTVLVHLGKIRPVSDIGGRHVIRMDNSPEKRQELLQRLSTAGCPTNMKGTDWLREGDFEAASTVSGDETDVLQDANAMLSKLESLMKGLQKELKQSPPGGKPLAHGSVKDVERSLEALLIAYRENGLYIPDLLMAQRAMGKASREIEILLLRQWATIREDDEDTEPSLKERGRQARQRLRELGVQEDAYGDPV